MSAGTRLCEPLPWDSEFFGVGVARVTPAGAARLGEADEWCRRTGVDVAYLLVPSENAPTVAAAEQLGFRVVDVRIRLAYEAAWPRPPTPASRVELIVDDASVQDMPALELIAAGAHRDSRFYADPRFSRERCDELYVTWIRRCFDDDDTRLLVARDAERVAGYGTIRLELDRATIDLVAVAEPSRGGGVGAQLVGNVIDAALERGASRVEVVTQGRNAAAQRLYQRAGMVTDAVHLWLHKWYEKPTA